MYERRISIFTGHFGSGKTEVAVNYALNLAERFYRTAIVDFDIVNPFFRTVDVKIELENSGIRVITPVYANTNVDVPALPPEINMLFEKKEYKVVLDVGGDDLGARVLSRYYGNIVDDDYEMYFVINTRRPMTDTEKAIEDMIAEIEAASRIKVTKLINNTNLLGATTLEDVLEGAVQISRVSEKLGIPVGFTSAMECVAKHLMSTGLTAGEDLLALKKFIKLPWE